VLRPHGTSFLTQWNARGSAPALPALPHHKELTTAAPWTAICCLGLAFGWHCLDRSRESQRSSLLPLQEAPPALSVSPWFQLSEQPSLTTPVPVNRGALLQGSHSSGYHPAPLGDSTCWPVSGCLAYSAVHSHRPLQPSYRHPCPSVEPPAMGCFPGW
jgi:hypothetical protein